MALSIDFAISNISYFFGSPSSQDVIEEYQAEYVEYMGKHRYGLPARDENMEQEIVEQFYMEPLTRPHSLTCRDHEPGMSTLFVLVVKLKKEQSIYQVWFRLY